MTELEEICTGYFEALNAVADARYLADLEARLASLRKQLQDAEQHWGWASYNSAEEKRWAGIIDDLSAEIESIEADLRLLGPAFKAPRS